jgi:feruloyl esterase
VENGIAPDAIIASQSLPDGLTRTRPLCPYPAQAQWSGAGSSDDAANFACVTPVTDKKGRGHHKHGHGH